MLVRPQKIHLELNPVDQELVRANLTRYTFIAKSVGWAWLSSAQACYKEIVKISSFVDSTKLKLFCEWSSILSTCIFFQSQNLSFRKFSKFQLCSLTNKWYQTWILGFSEDTIIIYEWMQQNAISLYAHFRYLYAFAYVYLSVWQNHSESMGYCVTYKKKFSCEIFHIKISWHFWYRLPQI